MVKQRSKKGTLDHETVLKHVPSGPNELEVRSPVDFDLAVLILRVLEGWELGNDGLYRKYWPYIKKLKKSKNRFSGFFQIFFTKKSGKSKIAIFPEIAISGNRNLVGLVIASETPW